jgi:uncharacterized membrane protein HdeD (DUF308 family)
METKPNKNRWFLAINGIIAILFGLLLLLYSREIILGIVFYLGLAIALGGLLFLIIAINNLKKDKSVGMLILQSIFSLVIGLGIMFFDKESLQLFFLLLGIWAIISGIFQLVILVNIKRNLTNKNIILFNGLITIALGVVMILEKGAVAVFVFKVIGVVAILLGLVMVYLSIIIRKTAILTDEEKDLG